MVDYLKQYFDERNDETKQHYHVDESVTASKRRKEEEEFVITPCRAYHLIAVNNNGEFKKLLYYKGEELQSVFSDTHVDSANVVAEVEDAEEDGFLLDTNTVAELVQPGTFIAVRSPSNASECFFICEVIESGIAKGNLFDDGGHAVVTGERYAKVLYLQKQSESKKHAKYEHPQKQTQALLHIEEVFATNILIDANLKMDITEYQSILSATSDKEMSPTTRLAVYLWLTLIDERLPAYVSRVYAHNLQSQTLKDIQPQLAVDMDQLLLELNAQEDINVNYSRASYKYRPTTNHIIPIKNLLLVSRVM